MTGMMPGPAPGQPDGIGAGAPKDTRPPGPPLLGPGDLDADRCDTWAQSTSSRGSIYHDMVTEGRDPHNERGCGSRQNNPAEGG